MERIKFSVLVPVYNVEKYIDECIQSVINQTYANWELILVDDGTLDNSGAICDSYAKIDKRIRVIHKDNQGLISARRVGIENASGDYYCFLDSDDSIEEYALQVLYDNICNYNCECVIFGIHRVHDNQILSSWTEKKIYLTDKRLIYKKCFNDSVYNPMCRKCVKSTIFDGRDYSSYYGHSLSEDLLQSIEILENASSLLIINECLYNYRVNPNSITQTIRPDNYTIDHTIRECVLNFIIRENIFTKSDMKEYVGYALQIIAGEMSTILHFDIGFDDKKKQLDQLKSDKYVKRLLKYRPGIRNMGIKAFFMVECLKINPNIVLKIMRKSK